MYLEADGQEVLPKEEATVEIRLSEKNASAADSTEIFRYSENGAEKVEAELNEASGSLIGSFASTLSGEYAIVDARELAGDPAVQADAAGDEIILTPHKTIDAFRDGDENPDTDLDNQEIDQTDLYRLYLDAQLSGESKPIDLLIVVDQSGSMHKTTRETM